MALAGAPASAIATPAIHSPLPGYPRFRGVTVVHDGSAASKAREQAIASAVRGEASRTPSPPTSALTPDTPSPDCAVSGTNPGEKLCYWGGPVVKAHTVHLIFWEGRETEKHLFPPGYVQAVERYFENVELETTNGSNTTDYAVANQYGDAEGPGSDETTFHVAEDAYVDTEHSLPSAGTESERCTDPVTETESERRPCITDNDVHKEVTRAREAKGEGGSEATLKGTYLVFTPEHVGGCFYDKQEESEIAKEGIQNACAFAPGGYCGYHSSFEATEKVTPPVYAVVPDATGVAGCTAAEQEPEEPNGKRESADATLDTAVHEDIEMNTDPLGNGWLDQIGQEAADKCLPPETFEPYGGPLNPIPEGRLEEEAKVLESLGLEGKLYNQVLGGWNYYLQRIWSNAALGAESAEGACEQRTIHAEFEAPTSADATVPAEFNGESSGEASDPPYYWVWNFGDGMQVGTPDPRTFHTYPVTERYPVTRTVTLTVYDKYGNSNTVSKKLEVREPPPPPPPPPPPSESPKTTTTTTVSSTATVSTMVTSTAPVAHYSTSQVAAALGLRTPGATLAGVGTITLGHGKCPPACSVTASLYAKLRTTNRHRATSKTVLIGTISETIANGGSGTLALKLNATGRSLLARKHTVAVQLKLSVTGAEGGTWQLSRSYTLSASGKGSRAGRKASAHRRRAR